MGYYTIHFIHLDILTLELLTAVWFVDQTRFKQKKKKKSVVKEIGTKTEFKPLCKNSAIHSDVDAHTQQQIKLQRITSPTPQTLNKEEHFRVQRDA